MLAGWDERGRGGGDAEHEKKRRAGGEEKKTSNESDGDETLWPVCILLLPKGSHWIASPKLGLVAISCVSRDPLGIGMASSSVAHGKTTAALLARWEHRKLKSIKEGNNDLFSRPVCNFMNDATRRRAVRSGATEYCVLPLRQEK